MKLRAARPVPGRAIHRPFPALIMTSLAVLLATAAPARAELTSLTAEPQTPTACDPVTVRVEGFTTTPCESIIRIQVFGPEPIPEWMGPVPAFRTRIELTVQEPNPDLEIACVQQRTPYVRDLPLGTLPMGQHFVAAVDYRVPWSPDTSAAPTDTSRLNHTFFVAGRDSCDGPGCVLLDFTPFPHRTVTGLCDATGRPGGEGCFDVALVNDVPVGGVQLEILLLTRGVGAPGPELPTPPGMFIPASVTTTERSAGLELAWEADGSTAKIILFSTTDAAVARGRGSIVHVCYGIAADAPEGLYQLRFAKAIVADVLGDEIPHCPTFREAGGIFCVVSRDGCDVNGDGESDIRDIVRLVRCALAGDACPDTIEARADCNGDGTIDVRDVICCVRKALAGGLPPAPPDSASSGSSTRIGFTGPVMWRSPLRGEATLQVLPDEAFGGMQFLLEAPEGFRIVELRADAGAALRLEWARDAGGRVHGMVYRENGGEPIRRDVTVVIEPDGGAAGTSGALRIQGARGATWGGDLGEVVATTPEAAIPAPPLAAPAVYAARPNPFTGETEIPFALPAAGRAALRVYDVKGRLVRILVEGDLPSGVQRARWDGRDHSGRAAAAGIYFVKLSALGADRAARLLKLR